MAKSKKNSNYVTAKTAEKKQAATKQKQAKQKKEQIRSIAVPAVILLLILGAIFAVIYFGGGFDYNPEATGHVAIQLEGYSTSLHVELYGDDAITTVRHFTSLVNSRYYDGKTLTAYSGGNLYFGAEETGKTGIKGEFAANETENKIPFRPGTLVMARGEDYDSAYGRFFVVTKDTDVSALKGNYAAFGRITDGMDVIEEIISKLNVDADGKIPAAEQITITEISAHDSH